MAARFFSHSMPSMRCMRDPSSSDRYDRRGRHGPEIFFQDLTIDPWRSGAFPFRQFAHPINADHFPPTSSFYNQPVDPRAGHPNLERRSVPKMFFGRAMKKLYKQLSKAETFYTRFLSSFDSDTENIKKYATPEILRELWLQKIMGGDGNRRGSSDSQSTTRSDIGSSAERNAERFETRKAKLIYSLRIAMSATLDCKARSRKAASRLDSTRRLQKKVIIASEQIQELLFRGMKSREQCDGLRHEVELLKTLIDPETEKNKRLYRIPAGEDEGTDGSEEDDTE